MQRRLDPASTGVITLTALYVYFAGREEGGQGLHASMGGAGGADDGGDDDDLHGEGKEQSFGAGRVECGQRITFPCLNTPPPPFHPRHRTRTGVQSRWKR